MMKKAALLLVAVVMVVAVSTAGCSFNVGNTSPSPSASSTPSSQSLTNTYNSSKGFSIKYPSSWTKEESTSGPLAVLFALPTNNASENLNVQAYNLSAGDTLSSTTSSIIADDQNLTNFTQIQAGNTTLAGLPAYKLVFTSYDSKGNFLKIMQTWTVNAGKGYIITYKAAPNNYDTYLSTAQQMIDSFSIT